MLHPIIADIIWEKVKEFTSKNFDLPFQLINEMRAFGIGDALDKLVLSDLDFESFEKLAALIDLLTSTDLKYLDLSRNGLGKSGSLVLLGKVIGSNRNAEVVLLSGNEIKNHTFLHLFGGCLDYKD
jgi:Ran GTPase-activating protein (RanGAP) involved in mRNA processing and transport